jgi:hypothetical protein
MIYFRIDDPSNLNKLWRRSIVRTPLDETSQSLKAWKVRMIAVLPERKGVEVTFEVEGRDPIRFRTRRLGIGQCKARAAALAKFADQAGFGKAEYLFRCISALPPEFIGPIFGPGAPGPMAEEKTLPILTSLSCRWQVEDGT